MCLLGCHFAIQTNYRALEWMEQLKDYNSRLTCWSLALQPYNLTVCYRKSQENSNADVLPHFPPGDILLQEKGRECEEYLSNNYVCAVVETIIMCVLFWKQLCVCSFELVCM